MSDDWTPPDWVYRGKKPTSDSAYFENLTHCIFQAGLTWSVVDNKWPNFNSAFEGFNISKVAGYEEKDIERLLGNRGIVRNRRKTQATIDNAIEFDRIISEYGGFQKWLDEMDKTENYAFVVKELKKNFKHVGDSTAKIFLWSVGEEIKREDPHR